MTLNTKENSQGAAPQGASTPPAPVSSRRQSLPLVPLALVGALAVGSTAYFLGRSSTTPRSEAPPASIASGTSEQAEEKSAQAEEGAGETAPAEGGPITLSSEAEKTAGIQTTPARYVSLGERLTVPGTVEVSPNRAARVTPPVAGKVIALFASPGDRVQSGQRLVVLDSPEVAQAHASVSGAESRVAEARAQVQTAQAAVQQSKTRLASTQSALQRQREFARTGSFAQPSLQAAQNELNEAQSEQSQAQTELNAQAVIVQRNERLAKEQLVARAEVEQSLVAQQQAQTRVAQTGKRVAIAQQALAREQKVFQGGLLTRQAVQASEAEVRAAQGDVEQARKQEQAARTSLEGAMSALGASRASLRAVEGNGHAENGTGRIALFAPIGGTVSERGASLGQAVERSSEIFTIQNLQSVVVEANVPEASVARVRIGAPVEVTVAAYPNERFTGVVQSVGSQVDEKTRALPVRCLVGNRGGVLKPEMFAKVSLETEEKKQTLTVPDASVDEDGDKRFVYVLTGNRTFEKREVTAGQKIGAAVEILKGIKAGEKVVTEGMFVLKSESKKSELAEEE